MSEEDRSDQGGWEQVYLEDVAKRRADQLDPSETELDVHVGLEDIQSDRPYPDYSSLSTQNSTKRRFQPNDILFAKLRPYLRKVAYATVNGGCTNELIPLESDGRISPRYLLYRLSSNGAIRWAVRSSVGTRMPRTSWKWMKRYRFPLPPLEEQRKIASVLYIVDELIERTESVTRTATDLKRGLATELFTGGLHESERETGRWQNLASRKPASWDVRKARDLMEITRGASPRPKGDPELFGGSIPWIKISDVDRTTGQRVTSTVDTVTEKGSRKSKVVEEGTLLVANSGTVGFAIRAGMRACVHDGWLILRDYEESLSRNYLYHFINWNQNFLKSLAPGSTQTNLNTERFGIMDVFVPNQEEQEQIARILDTLDEIRFENRAFRQQLVKVKRGLMQDLLTGEVKTNDVDIEIPEEVAAYG